MRVELYRRDGFHISSRQRGHYVGVNQALLDIHCKPLQGPSLMLSVGLSVASRRLHARCAGTSIAHVYHLTLALPHGSRSLALGAIGHSKLDRSFAGPFGNTLPCPRPVAGAFYINHGYVHPTCALKLHIKANRMRGFQTNCMLAQKIYLYASGMYVRVNADNVLLFLYTMHLNLIFQVSFPRFRGRKHSCRRKRCRTCPLAKKRTSL